jgi:Cu(I)/Ag(I) efflux system membrane fusion protein
MLLGNDAAEGSEVKQPAEADRVFLLLKGHMRRMREQLAVEPQEGSHVEHIAVSPEFQNDLARIWEHYLAVGQALAKDDPQGAQKRATELGAAVGSVSEAPLDGAAKEAWAAERANLLKLLNGLKKAEDLTSMRRDFAPLSQEIGILAKAFGFGESQSVYELHCPMAFQGRGAVWYQMDDQVRNPYFGSTMLKCADRVEPIRHGHQPAPAAHDGHDAHSQH